MLKKISVDDVQLGMHIKEFCGAWVDHPFWRGQFVITDPKDLAKIRASKVREVLIDTDKGDDLPAASPPAPAPVPAEAVAAQQQAEAMAQVVQYDRPAHVPVTKVTSDKEFARAAAICRQATGAVHSMFQEARMGRAMDTAVAKQVVDDITDSVSRNGGALISLARLKTADDYTYMHSVAVCALMVALGRQLGLTADETKAAGFAGLLHDVGKMAIPMEVLNKPGKLTDEEFAIVKSHPAEGLRLLKESGVTDAAAIDVCIHHHEKTNGTGYPYGLNDAQISRLAKMGAVCDVYDAITSNRPYKAGWDPAQSLKQMATWVNGHFDPKIFQAFVSSLGIYPTGSLVLLDNNKLAVVVDQSPDSLLKPVVKAFFSTRSAQRITPEIINLSSASCRIKILGREDPDKWKFPDLDELWSGQSMVRAK
jgi:putative nucleotidyltransferase with HDIG domain